jgi:hypothetical protein
MANENIQITDALTGETIVREMTDEEQAEHNAISAKNLAAKEKKAQEEADLRAAKIAAYTKLGLSAEEIEALVSTPQPPRAFIE